MHLHLSLPAQLVDHPAFADGPFARSEPAAIELVVESPTTEPPAEGDDDDGGNSSAGAVFQIGIFLLIPLGMYFLLIRPQRRRAREQQALQRSIAVGDEVLLTSGVYGFITAIESDTDVIWVEVDDDVQLRVTRAAISGKVNVSSAAASQDTTQTGSAADSTEPDDE
jgi:preprotein translocase subunit YajC